MSDLHFLSHGTRKIITATAVFLLYGYLCRLLGIYFFWESKTIGWIFFWIMITAILSDRIKAKKIEHKETIPEKIGIGVAIFVIVIKGVLFFATQQTTAYANAVQFIRTNQGIQTDVGPVKSVFLIPFGGMSMSTSSQGNAGNADLHFIVKGSKKYTDLNLLMNKDFDTGWEIEINR